MGKKSTGTLCVHGGWTPGNGEPRQVPVIQSTTFKYESSDEMGQLFDLQRAGYFYTRLQNPTTDAVAAKIAALEGGVCAVLTSSGQAASFFALFNIVQAEGHIVAANNIYGGTFNLLSVTMPQMGVEVTFVPSDAPDSAIRAAVRPNTRAFFAESVSNPGCHVLDIERWAARAHEAGVPLVVDNTFPTPAHCRPLDWGADIVIHSTTKYLDGHGATVGGVVVDGGRFDWEAHADKYPGLTTPDESYHGLTYTRAFGPKAYGTKLTTHLMRDLGATQSPWNAYLLSLGIETLHLRMARHCENALRVARYLEQHPRVAWVSYPGLESSPEHERALKYCPQGTCGVMCLGLKGSRDEATRFMDALQLVAIATHVADSRSCVLHPASHTHRQLTDAQLQAAGIAPDLIRLSVGIEDADDIIADIAQALEA